MLLWRQEELGLDNELERKWAESLSARKQAGISANNKLILE